MDLTKGERDLLVRALRHYIHDQHRMITEAHVQYIQTKPVRRPVFEDHKQHHMKAIGAADLMIDKLRAAKCLP